MDFFSKKSRSIVAPSLLVFVLSFPFPLFAVDPIEGAGIAVGLTLGNTVAIPAKALSVLSGLIGGAASFIVTGGNVEITRQMWKNSVEGPYLITPSVARTAIGERPELEKK